jgi:hypothetical protein
MAADVVEAEIIDEITEPGVYDGLDEAAYHADPVPGGSLSASGAKLLLPPSCPALYAWRRDHPKVSAEFDFGTAAHKLILGVGQPICRLSYDDWRTKAAQTARDEARAQGYVPVLEPDWQRVEAMAAAIREHPVASALLDPERGKPEQSLFWQDDETGIWCRARLDWLPRRDPARRFIIADYKTAAAADPASIRKAVANYGYFMQAAWYAEGVQVLGLDPDPAFLFIFQEKTPPYLVTVAQLDAEAVSIGRARNMLAREMWRDCTQAGVWPGYTDDIELITLPPWAARTEGDY